MKDIKFRAWVIKDKKMDYQPVAFDEWTSECQPLNPVIDSIQNSKEPFNQILMQYTGLKDKNGTPIYEGDLVLANHYTKPFEIRFMCGCFVLYGSFCDTCEHIPEKKCEVIGNIYENPELLVQQNK